LWNILPLYLHLHVASLSVSERRMPLATSSYFSSPGCMSAALWKKKKTCGTALPAARHWKVTGVCRFENVAVEETCAFRQVPLATLCLLRGVEGVYKGCCFELWGLHPCLQRRYLSACDEAKLYLPCSGTYSLAFLLRSPLPVVPLWVSILACLSGFVESLSFCLASVFFFMRLVLANKHGTDVISYGA